MNIYILNILKEVFMVTLCFIGSIFNFDINYKDNTFKSSDKSQIHMNEVEEYKTIYKYDKSLPSDYIKVLEEGINGLYFKNSNGVKIYTRDKKDEVVLKGSGDLGYYKGWTTGYGADCDTCSGIGNVSCRINGKPFNLLTDGVYYNDFEYGDVRVVAATYQLFPCGTIIKVDNKRQEPFYAIVLDRGAAMEYSYNVYNLVHLDIAFKTEKDKTIYDVFNTNLTAEFKVQRWGF
ncbi:MAG: hypothetical protein IJZ36_05465 [Bacilli bacterium]|nr:hypothetical protein [Bacilli bacterium]